MTETLVYHEHLTEIWIGGEYPGPSGRWGSVTEGEIQDHGCNVLFSGTADECVQALQKYRGVELRLVPTQWHDAGEYVYSEGPSWELVIE